jgi:hypothetical protein
MAAKKSAAVKSAKSPARKSSDRKAGKAAKKRAAGNERPVENAGEALVTIDRRRGTAETSEAPAPAPALERRKKVQRRRQIDPTTCERDYSVDEVEFMNAMDDYKRKSGRMFPTCSEVLEVIRSLGYVKLSSAGKAMLAENNEAVAAEDAAYDEELMAEAAY